MLLHILVDYRVDEVGKGRLIKRSQDFSVYYAHYKARHYHYNDDLNVL